MPRPIPASFTAVDPQTLLTGEKLLADTLDDLGATSNWLDAYCERGDAISQSWAFVNTTGGTVCARTTNTFATVASWQVPELVGATTLTVVIAAKVRTGPVGANHTIEVVAVNGGSTFTVASGSLSTSVQFFTGSVTASFVAGFERINLRLRGNGSVPVEVWSILVSYPAPTFLPAGRAADGRVAFDGEFTADYPLSARTMQQLQDNEQAFNERPHVACNVSDLQNVVTPDEDRLPPYQHRWACVRLPDTERNGRTLNARVNVSTPLGAGVLRFGFAGTADLSGDGGQVALQLAAGKVRDVQVLDPITQLDVPSISTQDLGIIWHGLSVWPQPDPATWDVPAGTSSCTIHGVLVWGWS
jgi:hypothetical protein